MQIKTNNIKNFINAFCLFFLTMFVGLSFFVNPAFADTYTLSGKVSDSLGNNIDSRDFIKETFTTMLEKLTVK